MLDPFSPQRNFWDASEFVKKKRRLFSVPIQLCRSLDALPHNLLPSDVYVLQLLGCRDNKREHAASHCMMQNGNPKNDKENV
jgi:hypothetical protein